VLEDSHYFLSPYPTTSQTLTVKLDGAGKSEIVDYTQLEPSTLKNKGGAIVFGPYGDVAAMASSPMRVHFLNNAPFATFTDVLREIEVSHWGNIAVEEHFDLEHTGAKIAGGFSRLDYARDFSKAMNAGRSTPAFRSLTARLPGDAWGIYYRDRIGNVSTSMVKHEKGGVLMEVEPRYPMLGGWKINFYHGYNIPSSAGLSLINGERYSLEMNFGVPYEAVSCDHLEVKVVLPEGAYDIEVDVPFDVRMTNDRRFTYVDSKFMGGRPVIIFEKDNVVKEHNVPFTVTYRVRPMAMLIDVGILVGAYLLIYIVVMFVLRVNLTLEDAKPEGKKAKRQ